MKYEKYQKDLDVSLMKIMIKYSEVDLEFIELEKDVIFYQVSYRDITETQD